MHDTECVADRGGRKRRYNNKEKATRSVTPRCATGKRWHCHTSDEPTSQEAHPPRCQKPNLTDEDPRGQPEISAAKLGELQPRKILRRNGVGDLVMEDAVATR